MSRIDEIEKRWVQRPYTDIPASLSDEAAYLFRIARAAEEVVRTARSSRGPSYGISGLITPVVHSVDGDALDRLRTLIGGGP